MKRRNGALLIVVAGVFWATMGIFVRALGRFGFDSIQISAFRLLAAGIGFWVMLALKHRRGMMIRLRDVPLFLGLGIGSISVMTCCYFAAIGMLTMSAAAILLYTSPIWVMLMSALFFRERITRRKVLALALAFSGCALVSGIRSGGANAAGVLVGVASGIAYGLYSILGSIALRRYSTYTVTAWGFSIAALAVLALARPGDMLAKIANAESLPPLIGLVIATGMVTAVIPYLLYTLGLEHVEPSRAAILATSEPMVASILGMLVFGEEMRAASLAGVMCILAAIVLLNLKEKHPQD